MPKMFSWAKKLSSRSTAKGAIHVPVPEGEPRLRRSSNPEEKLSPDTKVKCFSSDRHSGSGRSSPDKGFCSGKRQASSKSPSPEKDHYMDKRSSPEKGYYSSERRTSPEKRHNSDRRPSPEKRRSSERKTPSFTRRLASFRILAPDRHKSPDKRSQSKSRSPDLMAAVVSETPDKLSQDRSSTSPEKASQMPLQECRLELHTASRNINTEDHCESTTESATENSSTPERFSTPDQSDASDRQSTTPDKYHTPDSCPTPEKVSTPELSKLPTRQSISEKLYGEVIKEFDKIRGTKAKQFTGDGGTVCKVSSGDLMAVNEENLVRNACPRDSGVKEKELEQCVNNNTINMNNQISVASDSGTNERSPSDRDISVANGVKSVASQEPRRTSLPQLHNGVGTTDDASHASLVSGLAETSLPLQTSKAQAPENDIKGPSVLPQMSMTESVVCESPRSALCDVSIVPCKPSVDSVCNADYMIGEASHKQEPPAPPSESLVPAPEHKSPEVQINHLSVVDDNSLAAGDCSHEAKGENIIYISQPPLLLTISAESSSIIAHTAEEIEIPSQESLQSSTKLALLDGEKASDSSSDIPPTVSKDVPISQRDDSFTDTQGVPQVESGGGAGVSGPSLLPTILSDPPSTKDKTLLSSEGLSGFIIEGNARPPTPPPPNMALDNNVSVPPPLSGTPTSSLVDIIGDSILTFQEDSPEVAMDPTPIALNKVEGDSTSPSIDGASEESFSNETKSDYKIPQSLSMPVISSSGEMQTSVLTETTAMEVLKIEGEILALLNKSFTDFDEISDFTAKQANSDSRSDLEESKSSLNSTNEDAIREETTGSPSIPLSLNSSFDGSAVDGKLMPPVAPRRFSRGSAIEATKENNSQPTSMTHLNERVETVAGVDARAFDKDSLSNKGGSLPASPSAPRRKRKSHHPVPAARSLQTLNATTHLTTTASKPFEEKEQVLNISSKAPPRPPVPSVSCSLRMTTKATSEATPGEAIRRPSLPTDVSSSPAQRSPVPTQISPLPIQRSPLPIQRSPVPIQRSPVPIQRSPVPIQRSPVPIQRSPVPTQRSPVPIQRSPVPMQTSPIPVQRSQVQHEDISVPKQRMAVSLNPFDSDEDDDVTHSQEPKAILGVGTTPSKKPMKVSLNPFDSDIDDDEDDDDGNVTQMIATKPKLPPVGYNPFDEDDDDDDYKEHSSTGGKPSQVNGTAERKEVNQSQRPSSSTASPASPTHHSFSVRRLTDSTGSLSSQSSKNTSETPSMNPFDEDEDDDDVVLGTSPLSRESVGRHSLAARDSSPFQRDGVRASLPASGRLLISKKKRQAPLPPGFKPHPPTPPPPTPPTPPPPKSTMMTHRSDFTSSLYPSRLRKDSTTSTSSLSLSSYKRAPPPRPPPPKVTSPKKSVSMAQL